MMKERLWLGLFGYPVVMFFLCTPIVFVAWLIDDHNAISGIVLLFLIMWPIFFISALIGAFDK